MMRVADACNGLSQGGHRALRNSLTLICPCRFVRNLVSMQLPTALYNRQRFAGKKFVPFDSSAKLRFERALAGITHRRFPISIHINNPDQFCPLYNAGATLAPSQSSGRSVGDAECSDASFFVADFHQYAEADHHAPSGRNRRTRKKAAHGCSFVCYFFVLGLKINAFRYQRIS